jgi:hypothetical protein
MAEKIAKTGVKRDNDLMYYIKNGDVWGVPRKKPGQAKGKATKVAAAGVEMDYTKYIYFLDKDGDVARSKRQVGGSKRKKAAKKAAPKKAAAKKKAAPRRRPRSRPRRPRRRRPPRRPRRRRRRSSSFFLKTSASRPARRGLDQRPVPKGPVVWFSAQRAARAAPRHTPRQRSAGRSAGPR